MQGILGEKKRQELMLKAEADLHKWRKEVHEGANVEMTYGYLYLEHMDRRKDLELDRKKREEDKKSYVDLFQIFLNFNSICLFRHLQDNMHIF